jgi:hypothetical protein
MSNRYIDFALAANISNHIKKHLRQPTNEKEQKRQNRVDDITEAPKKIWGNEAHRRKVRQVQDAMNYRNEADRIHSLISSGRVPANRERIYRARQRMLEQKYKQIVPPLVSEGGVYHHV